MTPGRSTGGHAFAGSPFVERVGVFPGTFNPPTVAHLAIAEAALDAYGLDRIDFVLSRSPIGKEHVSHPPFEVRVAVLAHLAVRLTWMRVVVTDLRLIADIAEGYDVVIMGADKWVQIQDPVHYGGSPEARDEALRRLPRLALFAREGFDVTPTVEVDPAFASVSSTLARSGAHHLMAPEALRTGFWSEGHLPGE